MSWSEESVSFLHASILLQMCPLLQLFRHVHNSKHMLHVRLDCCRTCEEVQAVFLFSKHLIQDSHSPSCVRESPVPAPKTTTRSFRRWYQHFVCSHAPSPSPLVPSCFVEDDNFLFCSDTELRDSRFPRHFSYFPHPRTNTRVPPNSGSRLLNVPLWRWAAVHG